MRRKQRHQYEDVLGPLVRPQRTDHRPQRARARRKCAHNLREAGSILFQPRPALNYNCTACAPPYRKIFALVSAVIETTLAETFDELGCLRFPGQIDAVIACQNPIEQAQMRRNALSQPLVRSRAQPQASPRGTLRLQPAEELLVVRQSGRVQRNARGDLGLQYGLATEQPERNDKHVERVALDEQNQRLEQQIGQDECPVQVDT
jgi:hypothetical protein